jgi:cysteinyl-tRNA synthetase
MSTKYLGETFDIHGGGMDLKFPHHECEIAQAKGATGKDPVHYWVHSNMLTVNGQKMSKSLGNSFLPSELFAGTHKLLDRGYTPMTVRFFMLQSHYSSTLDFSNDALAAAEKGFKKLTAALNAVREMKASGNAKPDAEVEATLNQLVASCYQCMSDDFNTAKTLAILFEMSSRINDIKSGNLGIDKISVETFENFKSAYIGFMEDVLGLKEESAGDNELLDGTIQVLIELRKKARVDRNYALSDRIRDDLKNIGVQLKDGKDGEITYTID